MILNKNDKIDAISDIMRDILDATDENLRTIPLIGLVRETPLAVVNKRLNTARDNLIKKNTEILGDIGTALNIDTKGLQKEVTKNITSATSQFRLKNVDSLKKDLFRATQEGIEKQPKVITKSGRKYDYKSYMEMNIRTTIAHELTEMQLETGGDAGVIFYLCNIFEDAADDHAPFQGKYYYDERFKQFGYDKETLTAITKAIRDKKIMPLQYVQKNKPFLGTRPNCRHTFTPVSLEQVVKIPPKKLSGELGTTTGVYKDAKYTNTQKLRGVERTIRDYDYKYKINKELRDNAKDPKLKEQFNKVAQHNRKLATKWRKRRVDLVEKHDYLKTDTRREKRSVVLNDLGLKYNSDIILVFNELEYKRATLTRVEFEKWLKNESERLEFDFLSLI